MNIAANLSKLVSQSHPLRFLGSRLLWHSHMSALFTTNCGDYRLRFYPTSYSATLWLDPNERLADEQIFRKLLRKGDVVIDVGANIGSLTLAAASLVGPQGTVYSIEAHPRTYKYLLGNLRLNHVRNVTPLNVACGRDKSTVHFSNLRSDDQNHIADVGLSVPVERLDDLVILLAGQRIALLKIDVEGYEKFVLEGAARLLARTNAIYFESWEAHYNRWGYHLGEVLGVLRGHGFNTYRLSDGPAMVKVDEGYRSLHCENLLSLKPDAPRP